jgi:hypothetical protein
MRNPSYLKQDFRIYWNIDFQNMTKLLHRVFIGDQEQTNQIRWRHSRKSKILLTKQRR